MNRIQKHFYPLLMVMNWGIRIAYLGLLMAASFSISAQKSTQVPVSLSYINRWLDSLGRVWVPDKREGIFSITARQGNHSIIFSGESDQKDCIAENRKKTASWNISITDSIRLLPEKSIYPACWALVNISVANLRAQPGHEKELVSQAILGTPVFVLKARDKWLLIQTPDKYIGWITGSSVIRLTPEQLNDWKKSPRAIYLSNDGWIFAAPGSHDVISDLAAGSILSMNHEKDGFLQLILPDGRMGYSPKENWEDVTLWMRDTSPKEEELSRCAMSLNGVPYLWGGTSSKGMDCSGFTKTVYFMNGIVLARDASLQYRHGKKIEITDDFRNLRKGDLLFFGTRENGKDKVTHVGMYLESGEIIHANTSTSRISVNHLIPGKPQYNEYLRKTLLGVRRVIDQTNSSGIIPVSTHSWYTFSE